MSKEKNANEEQVLQQLHAIGHLDKLQKNKEWLTPFIALDAFYREIGGVQGYYQKILSLLKSHAIQLKNPKQVIYHSPSFIDITEEHQALRPLQWGIEGLADMMEIYPLGGAADRLHLLDEKTRSELPAAKLSFAGRTLFEGLIRDLQAREYLYFKLKGEQITVPIAIMTSLEKNNHLYVKEIAEEKRWFGRPPSSIWLFPQPLVPMIDQQGEWCISEEGRLLLKPGGHGVIWKLARDEGIFTWALQQKKTKALIRQINNPIAGLDYGLLAFTGIGWKKNMKFGFASCPRLLQVAEGVNVLIENTDEKTIVLTNIEYCDFQRFGVRDEPMETGSPYSRFSSNTNLLFADLSAVQEAVAKNPFPGLLVNWRNGVVLDANGQKKETLIARLESTMQNLADVFVEKKRKGTLRTQHTYITYNVRHKTISVAKKAYRSDAPSFQETPEQCFYELQVAARELLEKRCSFQLPPPRSLVESLRQGPEMVFLYHPALGPLYSIISQKIQGGFLSSGSELRLEIADLSLRELQLQGSLSIEADQPMGHFGSQGTLHYSHQTGRCLLEKVRISNRGVHWNLSAPFWKGNFVRMESVQILLRGHSEFIARDVSFRGNHRFEVFDGERLVVAQKGDSLAIHREKISAKPLWSYSWTKGVLLERQ